ncbi:putative reverse transcriptase domain-containing protein [Tanacetum coccineum]
MSMVLQERGFGSLPSSTETNPRDQVKSISTTIEADSHLIRHIGSSQYAVSTGQNSTPLYKARQTTVPFPSRLDNHYCEEEGNYGPKFTEACGASHINNAIPRKEKDPGSFTLPCFINDFCFDNALVDLGASVSVMPLSTYLNLGLGELVHTRLTVELADRTVKYPKGIAENVLVGIGKFTFPVDFIILDMPEDIRVPLILGRPFLSTARAKIDVYKRKITLRVGEEKIIFKSVKPASSIIKRVYMLSLRERMELDLEARLMGETLVINRSLDPFLEDYIELNDLNEPFELRRNQGNDLMPTIEEGEVIEEFRTRNEDLDTGIDDYPSYCDDDKKIHIDCAHNLKFSCMIGFEFTHANFFPLLYVNMMSRKFHNSIMKNKMVYKGNNVIGALMNVPIFVGTFSVMTDFAVLENMDAYRDEGMGDVIFGEPFLREADIKAKQLDKVFFQRIIMILLLNQREPKTYFEASKYSHWIDAMNQEMNALLRNGTWELVELPEGRKAIGSKWIYKIKFRSSGEIDRYKARLVAQGFGQKEGIDYEETFSPVVKMVTVRCLLNIVVSMSWPVFQLDVNNAFLYGDLEEVVYMKPPEGYFPSDNKVCRLKKSLYGLKQAPRQWNAKLTSTLIENGFSQSKSDYSLYTKSDKGVFLALLVYVDDIIITGNSVSEIEKFKVFLKSKFMIKDLGKLKYFLGIEVVDTDKGICLNQRKLNIFRKK